MKIFNILLSTLFIALLVLAFGAACYYVYIYAVGIYKGLDTKVINIIYAALAAGLLTMVLTSKIGKRLVVRDKNRQVFPRKVEIYQKFIKAWSNLVRNNEMAKEYDISALYNELQATEKEFMLLASARVIKKYIELQSNENEPDKYISAFGQLILEIRQDLGNSNVGLSGDKLASLFFETSMIAEQQDNNSSDNDREVRMGV